MRRARTRVRGRWGETDAAGIVYYPNYFSWFVVGTLEVLRSPEGSYAEQFHGESVGLPAIEAHCRFLAPVTYDEELEIETIVVEVRTRTFRVDHVVWRGEERVAEGYEVRGWQRIDRYYPHKVTLSAIPDEVVVWLRGDERTGPEAGAGD